MLPGLFNIEKYIVKANLHCSIFYGNMVTLKYEVITKKKRFIYFPGFIRLLRRRGTAVRLATNQPT